MPGAIANHRYLVAVVTVLVAVAAIAYSLHQPKVYSAKATVAVVPPGQDQALGPVDNASPEQYLDSQLVLVQSWGVAVSAANMANAALHHQTFRPSDFSGPGSSLSVAASQTANDQNTTNIINISFRAHSAVAAAAGANAALAAYQSARVAALQATYSSIISAIDGTLEQVNADLAAQRANGAVAAALDAQRADLLQRRTLALVDEKVAGSQSPPTVTAFTPTSASNHKVTKTAIIGAIVGFLLGTLIAYRREVRGGRPTVLPAPADVIASPTSAWAAWDAEDQDRTAPHPATEAPAAVKDGAPQSV